MLVILSSVLRGRVQCQFPKLSGTVSARCETSLPAGVEGSGLEELTHSVPVLSVLLCSQGNFWRGQQGGRYLSTTHSSFCMLIS